MRVLLISANQEHFPEPVFPLGTVYVANALMRYGVSVRIFDTGLYHFPMHSLQKEILRFRPDRIGISLRNIDNAAYPVTRFYLPCYEKMVNTIRSKNSVPIVLGGSAFSLFPEEIMGFLKADSGIRGEGEAEVVRFWQNCDKKIYSSMLSDLRIVKFPENIEEIFPRFRRYRTIGIQTARGCPNRCIYCTYPLLEGNSKRKRPPEMVADEMELINKKFGKRNFFIVDSSFNSDEKHMEEVLREIISRNLNIRFSCYLQPKMEDRSSFALLKKAGCVAIDFGTDSGSEKMIYSMKKNFTIDDVKKASLECKKEGIDFCHSLIFGGPGETSETIKETVSLMDSISPKAIIAMTGIRIYPGTEIEQIAQKEGYIKIGESMLNPKFYFSSIGPALLIKEVSERISGRRNWFFPGEKDWSLSLGTRLLFFFYQKGPLWRTFKQ